jgi:hypothetical protein
METLQAITLFTTAKVLGSTNKVWVIFHNGTYCCGVRVWVGVEVAVIVIDRVRELVSVGVSVWVVVGVRVWVAVGL